MTHISQLPFPFPKHLVAGSSAAMDQLFDWFPDHTPELQSEDSDNWYFAFKWSMDLHRYIDTAAEGVAKRLYNLSPENITAYSEKWQVRDIDFILAMTHSHALLAASQAIKRHGGTTFTHIVHVDAHTDLMPVAVAPMKTFLSLKDVLFNQVIELSNPFSVMDAIKRGVIHKGNFLTTYIVPSPAGTLIHVYHDLEDRLSGLHRRDSSIQLADQRFDTIELELRGSTLPGSWKIWQCDRVPTALESNNAGNLTVWLDVDMDAFCNRYDGDEDKKKVDSTDAEYKAMLTQIDLFLSDLSDVSWLRSVKAVSVAISPGFFPSDYWEQAIPLVCNGIKRLL